MALIYSDTAMLVDLLFTQAEQTKEGRKVILLTLPSLWKKKKKHSLQVSALIAVASMLFETPVITSGLLVFIKRE